MKRVDKDRNHHRRQPNSGYGRYGHDDAGSRRKRYAPSPYDHAGARFSPPPATSSPSIK